MHTTPADAQKTGNLKKPIKLSLQDETQPLELVLAAIKEDARNFSKVINKTDEICKFAMDQCPDKTGWYVLANIDNQSDFICKYAIDLNYRALRYCKNQTDALCKYAISKNVAALDLCKVETDDLKWFALNQDVESIEFIKNPTQQMVEFSISNGNIDALVYVDELSYERFKYEVTKKPSLIKKFSDACLCNLDGVTWGDTQEALFIEHLSKLLIELLEGNLINQTK